jgi:hypothetical protein
MQQITLPCLMTWGFPEAACHSDRAQPPSHPSFTDNELSALTSFHRITTQTTTFCYPTATFHPTPSRSEKSDRRLFHFTHLCPLKKLTKLKEPSLVTTYLPFFSH